MEKIKKLTLTRETVKDLSVKSGVKTGTANSRYYSPVYGGATPVYGNTPGGVGGGVRSGGASGSLIASASSGG